MYTRESKENVLVLVQDFGRVLSGCSAAGKRGRMSGERCSEYGATLWSMGGVR